MKKIINNILGNKYYAVLIYDGYKHYISSNIFLSHQETIKWIENYNQSSISAKAIDIISFKTKNKLTNKI